LFRQWVVTLAETGHGNLKWVFRRSHPRVSIAHGSHYFKHLPTHHYNVTIGYFDIVFVDDTSNVAPAMKVTTVSKPLNIESWIVKHFDIEVCANGITSSRLFCHHLEQFASRQTTLCLDQYRYDMPPNPGTTHRIYEAGVISCPRVSKCILPSHKPDNV
jgi:hypothetical protein